MPPSVARRPTARCEAVGDASGERSYDDRGLRADEIPRSHKDADGQQGHEVPRSRKDAGDQQGR